MIDMFIIDKSMDEREFRNYVCSILPKLGFNNVRIEDTKISDEDKINDNDMFADKNDFSYTVQTFLNKNITKKELDECVKDMDKDNVTFGLIVTNTDIAPDIKTEANKCNIEIVDRSTLVKII